MKNRPFDIRVIFIVIIFFLCQFILTGQTPAKMKTYEINVTGPEKKIFTEHLKLGGTNSNNESIKVNNFYFLKNDKPFIPVTGEFHFCRYPNKYWDESIRKMKAGGINVIATYVFWNIHEEHEGEFDWQGDKNLRQFVELCAKNDIKLIVRLGPFCHGEIRNGGLPDWLFARNFDVRSNDPEYLAYVECLFNEIGMQLKGLYFKDDGPVIGVQLENEYQHSASPWALTYPGQPHDWTVADRDRSIVKEGVSVTDAYNPYIQFGSEHMKVLNSLAEKAGIIVPIITATGWGNAAVIENESIPVTAAYPYPTWVPASSLSAFYLYTDLQKKPDYSPVKYKPADYPYFPAEIGGGMCNNYNRRPTIPAESLDALINRFLGSGSNGIGYYMFHGGANPKSDKYFYSDEAYAYPKINYDYQAPIGQYGQISPSFNRLKLIHFFLNSFGDRLAPMSLYLPETNVSITPDDSTTLRYSVRSKDGSGFIFLQNFQDHINTADKTGIQIKISTKKGEITIPENNGFSIKSNESMILPFNFDLGGVTLNYSTSQILTSAGDKKNPSFIFFVPDGLTAEFSFDKQNVEKIDGKSCKVNFDKNTFLVSCYGTSEIIIKKKSGGNIKILQVEKSFALKSWIINSMEKKYIIFSDAIILETDNGFDFFNSESNSFNFFIYPKMSVTPTINKGALFDLSGDSTYLSEFSVEIPEVKYEFKTERFGENKLQLSIPENLPVNVSDAFIKINYIGDTGMSFMNGELIDDQFYYGEPWIIGLKKFYDLPLHNQINFYFRPIYRNASFLVDLKKENIPDFSGKQYFLNINKVDIILEYNGIVVF